MAQAEIHLDLPPQSASIDLSIVIVSYNTKEMTLACVQSILDNKGAIRTEIIVVDNCSSDGSAAALRHEFPQITVIDSPANAGFAFGNNIGFEQSSGRYVLLLNPDTRVFAGSLEKAVAYMDTHDGTGIMGPKVLLDDGTQQSSMIRYLNLTQLFFIIFMPSHWMRSTSFFGDLRYAGLSREKINSINAVSGCFMLVRREILKNIGGLDQRFFMYGEETEWCHRITQKGWEIHYNPNVEILHHGAASTKDMSEWKSVEITKGHILFLAFTRGAFVAWLGTLFMLLRDLVRIPFYATTAVFNGFKWTGNAKPWRARLAFLIRAIVKKPEGQKVRRPSPSDVMP